MRISILLFIGLLFLAVGCQDKSGDLRGPEEAPSLGQTDRQALPSLLPANSAGQPADQVTIAALVTNPAAFEGRLLQVEGLFRSTLDHLCSDRRFGAPASWALAAGQEQIAAGGLDGLAAALPDGQITLVVEGAWRSWPIPANCRQQGDPTELYYLEVAKVISPNPIALAPGDPGGATDPQPPAGELIPAEEQPAVIPTATPAPSGEQPPQAATEPGAYPAPIATPTVMPGGYPGPAIATPAGQQATAVPVAEVPLDRDSLLASSLELGALGPGISERWPYVITATQTIDLQVMPEAGLALIATVLDRNGQVLSANSSTDPGQIVTLPAVNLPEAGEYTILVTTLDGGAGNYALLLSHEDTYHFQFQGNLADEVIQSGELLPESDHIYFFSGSAGEVVDITARPTADADLFLRLFDPSGAMLLSFFDESPAGQEEQITAYNLPETGLYALLIGEAAFAGGAYAVVLDR